MSAQYVVTFQDPARDPEIVVADHAGTDPATGGVFLVAGDLSDASSLVVQALYAPSVGASVRRLPDPPGGGLYARARAGLRWLFT